MMKTTFVICVSPMWLVFVLINIGLGCSNINGTSTETTENSIGPEVTLKLSPSENNPRNSEGDFVELEDGRIMFIYSKYVGDSAGDHDPASLVARYSSDGGQTWTSEDELVVANKAGMNVMSVSLLRLQNGDIALFYARKNSITDCIPMMRISKDEAKTWSDPIPCITDRKGYFVLNNDRVIQFADGRLVMPVSLHNTPDGEWHNQGDLYSYYSDDNGRTWTSSLKVPNNTDIITQEPGLIEMKDGRIMMFIRASGNYQQLSFSSDRGVTWSPIQKSNIPSPVSPATIEQIPSTGDWMMAWNNNDGIDPDLKGKRTPYTVAVSKNEGQSWEYIKNIETNPHGWYCYTAMFFHDENHILLGHCAGDKRENNGLAETHVTRLTHDWLYDK